MQVVAFTHGLQIGIPVQQLTRYIGIRETLGDHLRRCGYDPVGLIPQRILHLHACHETSVEKDVVKHPVGNRRREVVCFDVARRVGTRVLPEVFGGGPRLLAALAGFHEISRRRRG